MRVICIENSWRPDENGAKYNSPIFGSIYTVRFTRRIERYKKYFYSLMEFPEQAGYAVDCFIPLSSIDETSFERNYNLQPEQPEWIKAFNKL